MISSIEGELVATSVDSVDISINGLTLNVVVPSSTVEVIGNIGDKVKLHTTFIHKDDSMVLYGFKTTRSVNLETMILHAKAVKEASKKKLARIKNIPEDSALWC